MNMSECPPFLISKIVLTDLDEIGVRVFIESYLNNLILVLNNFNFTWFIVVVDNIMSNINSIQIS